MTSMQVRSVGVVVGVLKISLAFARLVPATDQNDIFDRFFRSGRNKNQSTTEFPALLLQADPSTVLQKLSKRETPKP